MSRSITIVFVHGWGMNSAVWDFCVEKLPDWMLVKRIDLPGHGINSGEDVKDFESIVQSVAATVDEAVIWVGWSLGGLVCLRLAEQFPEKVLGLCLVATNPCFVKQEGWHSAIDKTIFDDFSKALKQDIDKTIKRFLALQVTGSKTIMTTIKKLQKALQSRGRASTRALDLGLDILSEADLRESLKTMSFPVKWILGSRDKLVPVVLAESLKLIAPNADVIVVDDAAHAPFISHPELFAEQLTQFSLELRGPYAANT